MNLRAVGVLLGDAGHGPMRRKSSQNRSPSPAYVYIYYFRSHSSILCSYFCEMSTLETLFVLITISPSLLRFQGCPKVPLWQPFYHFDPLTLPARDTISPEILSTRLDVNQGRSWRSSGLPRRPISPSPCALDWLGTLGCWEDVRAY